jgi:hypothetical protein
MFSVHPGLLAVPNGRIAFSQQSGRVGDRRDDRPAHTGLLRMHTYRAQQVRSSIRPPALGDLEFDDEPGPGDSQIEPYKSYHRMHLYTTVRP